MIALNVAYSESMPLPAERLCSRSLAFSSSHELFRAETAVASETMSSRFAPATCGGRPQPAAPVSRASESKRAAISRLEVGGGVGRSMDIVPPDQYWSELMTSLPAQVARACQVVWLMFELAKRTLPSPIITLQPPGCSAYIWHVLQSRELGGWTRGGFSQGFGPL